MRRLRELFPRRLEWEPRSVILSGLLIWWNGGGLFWLLVLAALLHETGHLLVAGCLGRPVEVLRLELMGATLVPQSRLGDYASEAAVAWGGALGNLLGAVLGFFLIRGGGGEKAVFFFFANVFLALSNLLPAEGLDGGVILYALAASRADAECAWRALRWGTRLSVCLASVLGLWLLRLTGNNLSVLVLCAGLLLRLFGDKTEKRPP